MLTDLLVTILNSNIIHKSLDFMVRDQVTMECFRADKLLEDAIDSLIDSNPNMIVQEQEQHRVIQVPSI